MNINSRALYEEHPDYEIVRHELVESPYPYSSVIRTKVRDLISGREFWVSDIDDIPPAVDPANLTSVRDYAGIRLENIHITSPVKHGKTAAVMDFLDRYRAEHVPFTIAPQVTDNLKSRLEESIENTKKKMESSIEKGLFAKSFRFQPRHALKQAPVDFADNLNQPQPDSHERNTSMANPENTEEVTLTTRSDAISQNLAFNRTESDCQGCLYTRLDCDTFYHLHYNGVNSRSRSFDSIFAGYHTDINEKGVFKFRKAKARKSIEYDLNKAGGFIAVRSENGVVTLYSDKEFYESFTVDSPFVNLKIPMYLAVRLLDLQDAKEKSVNDLARIGYQAEAEDFKRAEKLLFQDICSSLKSRTRSQLNHLEETYETDFDSE